MLMVSGICPVLDESLYNSYMGSSQAVVTTQLTLVIVWIHFCVMDFKTDF